MLRMRNFAGVAATLAILAASSIVLAGPFRFGTASAEKSLTKSYQQRLNARSCEPVAPIQTQLTAPKTATFGTAINVRFDAMLMEFGAKAEYRIDVPKGVRLVAGKQQDSGKMEARRGYVWDSQFVVDQPGTFEVHIQIIAGDDQYRFGQRQTLYIRTQDGRLLLATEKPKANPVLQDGPLPAYRIKESVMPVTRPVGAPPPTEPFKGETDPYGNLIDNWPNTYVDASVTVTGTWRYRHTDATLHAGYGSWVEAWDDDTIGADDFLARTTADASGNFSLTFDNADDLGFGTADVYLVFRSENTRVQVHNLAATSGYPTATGVIFPNIGTGTLNAGGWYADWGTNGVSDSDERAFQLTDDLTTAWQHWNYYSGINFDNRMTYCQWYVGSTDGSYYLTAQNRLFIEDSDVSSIDVVMHEYGHSLHDGLFSDVQWPPGTGGPHSFTGHYTTGLAWTEGFATYYCCTAQGNDWIYNSYDPGNLITFDCDSNWDGNGAANGNSDGLSTGANTGYDTESAVLSFMLDIDDGRNSTTDPFDWSTLGDDEIFDVMRNYSTGGHRPYSVQEFFDGWHSIIDVQNPKINAQMHNHGMPQAINFPPLGISDGVDGYTGTWYYGGYGRGSYTVMNYLSRSYDLNRLYVWLRGPAGQDVGQFGSDGNGNPIASGGIRQIWLTADQTGYNPASPNFVYGNYTITAGFYRSDNGWQLLEPAETGTTQQITRNVIEDTTGPTSCAVQDDGANQTSLTTIHITAQSSDPDSSIQGYWTRVGSSPGLGNYQDWVLHPANNVTNWDYTITGLTIPNGAIAYVTVVSQNIESVDSPFAYTDGIKCGDTTAPGPVSVVDDGSFAPRNDQIHYTATTTEPDGGILMWWSRVGTSAGSGSVQDWVSYPVNTLSHNNTITGISMPTGSRYYVTAVARNYGGMDTFGYSNGILSPLYASGVSVVTGAPAGGSVASLQWDDSDRYVVLNDFANPNARIEFSAVCPVLTGTNVYLFFDASCTRSEVLQYTQMYNFTTNTWVAVDVRYATPGDTMIGLVRSSAPQYIHQTTRNMFVRMQFIPITEINSGGSSWLSSIDRLNWYVDP